MIPTPDRDISPPNGRSGAQTFEQRTDTTAGARSRAPATSSRDSGRSEFLMFYSQLNSAFAPTTGKDCGMSTLSIRCPHRGVDRMAAKNGAYDASTCDYAREISAVHTVHTLACLSQTGAGVGVRACEGVVGLGCGQWGRQNSDGVIPRLPDSSEGLVVRGSENRSVDSVDRAGIPTRTSGGVADA